MNHHQMDRHQRIAEKATDGWFSQVDIRHAALNRVGLRTDGGKIVEEGESVANRRIRVEFRGNQPGLALIYQYLP
ncbi:MAG: hypothetical protein ABI162_11390 [Luteolibacter sp.]